MFWDRGLPVFHTVSQIFMFSLTYGWFLHPLWIHCYLHLAAQGGITLEDVYPLLNLLDLEMVYTSSIYTSISYYSVIWSYLSVSETWKCGNAMCTIRRNRFFFKCMNS